MVVLPLILLGIKDLNLAARVAALFLGRVLSGIQLVTSSCFFKSQAKKADSMPFHMPKFSFHHM